MYGGLHTYLCDHFHLLSLAVLGFRNRSLESLDDLVIEFLHNRSQSTKSSSPALQLWRPMAPFLTAALDIINSISPRCALMSFSKFSQTFSSMPNRLFSAKVCRKFFTAPPLSAPPVCFSSSATIWDLSAPVRVGVRRMTGSLGSDFRSWLSELSALETESRALVFAAAVY